MKVGGKVNPKKALESDEQRLARLKDEETTQKKAERDAKRQAAKEEKEANQTPMDMAREKGASMLKLAQKVHLDASLKASLLEKNPLAKQVRDEYTQIAKRIADSMKQIGEL
eukprot:5347052-Alexandrium_andersonii.AAC.1